MIYLYLTFGVLGYLAGINFTFGFIAGTVCSPHESPWESPAPLLLSLVWPITLLTLLARPLTIIGRSFAESILQKEEKRDEEKKAKIIIAQLEDKKVRLELAALERELEEDINSFETVNFATKKRKINARTR
jgi:hypothetical protein